ncbi:MAG: hypothetical protein ABR577_01225 [Pyrinomonadaceae bacterium]
MLTEKPLLMMKPSLCGLSVALGLSLLLWARPVVSTTRGVAAGGASGVATMPKQCQPSKTSPQALGWRWKPGTLVRVYYSKDNFSQAEVAALSRGVNNWNAALNEIGSHIVFVISTEREGLTNNNSSVIVRRGLPTGRERVGEIKFHSISNGRVHMIMTISPAVTDLGAMTSLMTHELGHTLGLADCYECRRGTTAMAAFKSSNQGNDVYEPSVCDKFVVTAGYGDALNLQARIAH